ncbi:MAG: hypothetical protein JW981_11345, partial [Anaerolineae bacterium]|nr:hypothetical protein [Anaerolineae bacterium]
MKHITRWILACCILTGIIFIFLYLQPTEPVLGINGSIQKIIVQRMLDGVTSNVTSYDSGWINHTVDFDTKEAVCVTLYAQGGSADWTYQLSSNYGYNRSHTGAVTLYTFCPWPREGTYTPVIDQHSPGTFTLNPVYPDLVATQPSPDNGASFPPFCEGQTINWYTTVTNNSRAKAGGTYVAYFIVTNPDDYFYPFAEVGVGGLDPNEFQVVYASHTFQATDTGTRYLNVEADPGDGEAEADETNNRQSYGPFQVTSFPTNPTLSTPANQSHLCTTRPTFQWTSISGANNYHIQVDNNITFSSPEIDITTPGTAYTPYSDLAPDDYVWRVQASNNCGNGVWSPVWELTLLTTPRAPTLQSPASGSHHCDAPALSWTTITGATSYRLQVDNSESFSSPEIDTTTSYNSYSPGFGLGEGTYYWRVLANNACGAGVWSTSRRFIIEGSPPTPVLLSPQDNTIKCDPTPTLDWYSVSEADTYYIEVADNIGFNAPMIAENTTSSSYTPLSPLNPGLYYWRVYAANGCGQSAWSASRRVNILTTPTAPGLIMPLNHSQSSTTLPVFTWQAANLGETYTLEVDDSPALSSPEIDHTTAGTTYTPEHPLSEGVTYTWHVQAHNYCGNSPWSTAWQFAIPPSHTPPVTLTLKAPVNASHLCTHTPLLEWYPNPNATYYRVQIDTDAVFAETLISHTTTLTAYTPTSLTTTTPYYWRARAGNDCGTGPWSHVYSFTLHTLPATPELSHPQANSLITTTQLPVFEWHSINDVINYQLGVRRPGTATPVISITTPLTTYTPGTAITPTGYTWQVRATNRCGTGPWSGVWEFTLLPQPVSPTLLSPVNTQRISDTTRPTFVWTPVDWATSYQIQIDGAPAFTTPVLSQTTPFTYHTALTGLTPGEYYWRVRAANDGSNSPWSEIWRFTIQPKLDSPVLQTPADKSVITTSPLLQFSWLPVNYATAYQLRIGDSPSFLTWVLSYTTPRTSYTPPQPLVPGTYYWQVQANNTGGTGEWSPVWEFTINAPPGPGIPLLLAPPDKSITTTTRPAFIWTPADYATAYQLRISDNPGFSATG